MTCPGSAGSWAYPSVSRLPPESGPRVQAPTLPVLGTPGRLPVTVALPPASSAPKADPTVVERQGRGAAGGRGRVPHLQSSPRPARGWALQEAAGAAEPHPARGAQGVPGSHRGARAAGLT